MRLATEHSAPIFLKQTKTDSSDKGSFEMVEQLAWVSFINEHDLYVFDRFSHTARCGPTFGFSLFLIERFAEGQHAQQG